MEKNDSLTWELVDIAREYRLPLKSTQEDLERDWETVLRYGNKILLAGHWYNPDGKSWIAAVYEFLDDDETTCEDFVGIREVAEERFEDNGHAIAWAIQNA